MKWLGNTKSKITKNINGENVPHLNITEKTVNSDYQQDAKDFYTFVPNKLLGQLLLDILPKNLIFLKTFNLDIVILVMNYTSQFVKTVLDFKFM